MPDVKNVSRQPVTGDTGDTRGKFGSSLREVGKVGAFRSRQEMLKNDVSVFPEESKNPPNLQQKIIIFDRPFSEIFFLSILVSSILRYDQEPNPLQHWSRIGKRKKKTDV